MPTDYLSNLPGTTRPSNDPQNTTGLTVGYSSPTTIQPASVSKAKVDPITIQTKVRGQEKSKFLSMRTNFRTLKYSGDQPNNGTSQQPYIKTTLSSDWNANVNSVGYLNSSKTGAFADQFAKSAAGTDPFLTARQDIDSIRVRTFLKNNQKGKTFTTNQKALQFQNPKMEVGTTLNISQIDVRDQSVLSQIWGRIVNSDGALEYTRVYNDNANLLQQVGVSGTGNHYDRAGTYPVTPFNLKYYHIVKNKEKNRNRLVLLYNNKVATTDYRTFPGVESTADLAKLGITRDQNSLFNYLGGPTSTSTIKSTIIQRYDFTNAWNDFDLNKDNSEYDPSQGFLAKFAKETNYIDNTLEGIDPSLIGTLVEEETTSAQVDKIPAPRTPLGEMRSGPGYDPSANQTLYHRTYDETSFQVENYSPETTSPLNRPHALTYSKMLNSKTHADLTTAKIKNDFRAGIKGDGAKGVPKTKDYAGTAGGGYQDKVYNTGNPGNNNIDRTDYKKVGYLFNNQGVDRINATDIIQNEKDSAGIDLIKCIIRPVETTTLGNWRSVHESILVFRAFLTNFTDNINASYAEHTYVGRGEKFYTYQTADRKASFTLDIAAQSRSEMKPLYRKLNYLISQLYPEYSGYSDKAVGNGFMRSPLVKLTIGDYFYNTPGILTSANISVPDDAPWELESSNMHNFTTKGILSTDGDMYQLPHYLRLTLQFTPIHNFIPRRALATTVTKTDTANNKNYFIPPFITPHENSTGVIPGKNKFNIG